MKCLARNYYWSNNKKNNIKIIKKNFLKLKNNITLQTILNGYLLFQRYTHPLPTCFKNIGLIDCHIGKATVITFVFHIRVQGNPIYSPSQFHIIFSGEKE